ncbi:hypothetical protein EV426DRAFT_709223 [Tirmania nivea]|nr:hypothetical protein EV426DRAFT_709223 [Tirmania nivea]
MILKNLEVEVGGGLITPAISRVFEGIRKNLFGVTSPINWVEDKILDSEVDLKSLEDKDKDEDIVEREVKKTLSTRHEKVDEAKWKEKKLRKIKTKKKKVEAEKKREEKA